MSIIRAGDFTIDVCAPYPVWCRLTYHGETLPSFSHKELSDLHHAVQVAMREARLLLGKDKDEV